jgi:hypothetical protein
MDSSPEGYSDIAYNFLVAPNGTVFEGRGWGHQSGAQGPGNPSSIAFCYLGGPTTPLTVAARESFAWLNARVPGAVHPHSHWLATACPGPYVKAFIDAGIPPPTGTGDDDVLSRDESTALIGTYKALVQGQAPSLLLDLRAQNQQIIKLLEKIAAK